jgi:hypothetical protein
VANQLYKDYLLISRAEYDPKKECWIVKVNISWTEPGGYHFHSFDAPRMAFTSQAEAVHHGFVLARLWVDKRL